MDTCRRAVGLTVAALLRAVRGAIGLRWRAEVSGHARTARSARTGSWDVGVLGARGRLRRIGRIGRLGQVGAEERRPRRLLRVAAFLAVCGLVAVVPATPALAASCTTAPTPEAPGQGIAGFFLPTPNPIPPAEDPFAPGAKSTPFDQYGLAGLSWYLYDPGCGGAIRDPSGSISSWAGRTLFIPAKAAVAALVAVSGAALQPSYLGAFDPLLSNLTEALHKAVFTPLAPLAVMLTGLLLMARSTRQRVSESTTAVGWALLVMVIAAALFAWPVKAGHAADKAIDTAVGVVSKGLTSSDEPPGHQVANQLYNAFMYRMWLTGEFCDPNSVGARKYGPDILRAQAFSWSETQQAAQNGQASVLVQAHKEKFDQTADKIRQEDPVAYECVAGHSSAPLEASILADIGVLVMAPFLLVSGLILIAAYIIIRFAVILAPALLTAGAFFPLRGVVQAAARVVTAALINAVVFTICTLFVIRVDTTILDPTTSLPSWLRLVLLGVVTVVMWYLTRPFRKLTTMVTPRAFSESLNEVGAGWRARASAILRRRTQQEDMREAMEEALRESAPAERAGADARMREEARGPVSMPRRIRVSSERLPRAEALGLGAGGAAMTGPPPAGLPAGGPGALPGGPPDLTGVVVEGADGLSPVYRSGGEVPGPGRRTLVAGGVWPDGAGGTAYLDGDDLDHDLGIPVRPTGPAPAWASGRERSAPARQAEYAGPSRSQADGGGEGLFDPAAPYRPNPEDDPLAHLRHVRAQVIDGEEVYQLYDPATDPLAGNEPWSR